MAATLSIKDTAVYKAIRKREPAFLPQPLVVIRSAIRCPLLPQVGWEWTLISHPDRKKGHSLHVERETALEVIKICGLQEALRTGDGTLYDSKDKAFLRLYKGCGDMAKDD